MKNLKDMFMGFRNITVLLLLLSLPASVSASETATSAAACELIERVIPQQANHFVVETIPADHGHDVFEIESRDGKIVLRGDNGVAIASALNWYLKYDCHCQISWCGDNLDLPNPPPVVNEKVRRVTSCEHRVYLNYCTFSYTMAWWDWARWQREIDWMALHGINMPLAVTGQEAVW
ncbi:MAG TPA: alpha-N-acetylglucosaminidase N-terminal domain-containing protein, partial [Candidatus Binatia bacterium]|nr:alpha-N-acetylglucosaminidase N-terminal domain-containing protein [Candidatus Binatia bacterium]